MRFVFAAAVMALSTPVFAVNSFDPATGVLKLDSVVLGDVQFNNVT